MNKSINLLVPEEDTSKFKKRLDILRLTSLCILLSIVTLSVTLFFLILMSPLPELRTQEEVAAQKLRDLRTTSGKLFLVRERLGSISVVMNQRPIFDQMMTTIEEKLPSGVTVERVIIDSKSLSFTVSSSSLFSINSFITTMEDIKEKEKIFSSLTLSKLTYDQEKPKYIVTLQAFL